VSRALRADDVVVGLLTENTQRMLAQASRLVRSIRWFGGELARARIVVCGVGALESNARTMLESLGVEIRTVSRFHPANPTGNRHQLIAELLDAPQRVLFLLDCDTIVVRDPLPYLDADSFQAKIAPTPTVSDEVFERLFAHFGIAKPPRSHVTSFDHSPTIPYFNAGVIAIPTSLARLLAPAWRKYNEILANDPQLVAPNQRHMHQASLALALAETQIPIRELSEAMNFQINATHVVAPPGFAETDPIIIHYHQLATDDGFLLPTPYPAAQSRIEMFHARMRDEGFVQRAPPSRKVPSESRPIVVLGMHRSGTSLVAQLIESFGVHAGEPNELAPPDIFNPTGYWEHAGAAAIDRDILDELGVTWRDVGRIDLSRLPAARRATYLARAKSVVESMSERGTFLLKDPRMSLLFPLWREALRDPIVVIVWREPIAVARSLATRDRQPRLAAIAAWEHTNRTILREATDLPRVLISYEELLSDPMRVSRELHDRLSAFGLKVSMPSEERLRQIVNPDFNRSGGEPDDTLLHADQHALVVALRSGTAVRDAIPPTSAHTLEILDSFAAETKREESLKKKFDDAIELLRAVFESRTWRLGAFLRRRNGLTAEDRWRELKRK
jgi:hypothetical protein